MNARPVRIAALLLSVIVAAIFLYAGWQKMRLPQEFADNIAAYQLLPVWLINLFALTLPPLEIIVGCLLLTGWQRRLAAFSGLILAGMFMVALGWAIARGLKIDCGCFGSGSPSKGGLWVALGRDLMLGAALMFIYCQQIAVSIRGSG